MRRLTLGFSVYWLLAAPYDFVDLIDFLEFDPNISTQRDLDLFSDQVCFDGQFSASAIDQNGKKNCPRSSEGYEMVHGCSNGTAGVEDVVE